MKRAVLLCLGLLAACQTTNPVLMVNPKTGQTAQCGPYDNRPLNSAAAAMRESQCIMDYKEQGFVRR